MLEEKADYSVSMMARVLGVSRSGFYRWLKAGGSGEDPWVLKSTPDLPIWARFLHQPGQYRSTSTGNGISRNRCLRPSSRGCLQAGPWSCRTFR